MLKVNITRNVMWILHILPYDGMSSFVFFPTSDKNLDCGYFTEYLVSTRQDHKGHKKKERQKLSQTWSHMTNKGNIKPWI